MSSLDRASSQRAAATAHGSRKQTTRLAIKSESRAYFKALGAHIASLRKAAEMTQAELARAIGVSQQAVFAYELGERRVSVLVLTKLSKVFSIPLQDLAGMARPARSIIWQHSSKAMRQAERLQALSKTEQRFVSRIIAILEEQRNA